MEARAKGKSLPYHKKKLTYVLSSMRDFAIQCQDQGYPVLYHATHDHYNGGLERLLKDYDDLNITYMNLRNGRSGKCFVSSVKNTVTGSRNWKIFFLADPVQWVHNIKKGYRMEYLFVICAGKAAIRWMDRFTEVGRGNMTLK